MDESFNQAYLEGTARWDIGRPQGEVVALAESGESEGRVLEVGCGSGEHALYLSEHGYDVRLFHAFEIEDRPQYVASLSAVVAPAGRVFVMCFSENEPGDDGPWRVTRAEIRPDEEPK